LASKLNVCDDVRQVALSAIENRENLKRSQLTLNQNETELACNLLKAVLYQDISEAFTYLKDDFENEDEEQDVEEDTKVKSRTRRRTRRIKRRTRRRIWRMRRS
jgi:hypothetical protein